jgi:DNA-binding XRE family transcriptional regulator
MNEETFKSLMTRARTFHDLGVRSDFWRGLMRGLRRQYHGENFGLPEEHDLWYGFAKSTDRRELGEGYRAGYHYGDLRLAPDHPQSSYGIPVFVDRGNNPLDYADGVRMLRRMMGWSVEELGERCGVSPRTVQGWEQGRNISGESLHAIKAILNLEGD